MKAPSPSQRAPSDATAAAWLVIEHFERVDAPQRDRDVIAKAISLLTPPQPEQLQGEEQ